MKKAIDREVDVVFGLHSLQLNRMRALTETRPLYSEQIILVIPPPLKIGSIQKLLMPFSTFVWIGILSVFVISIIVVTVVKLFPDELSEIVLGGSMKNHRLNVLNVFLGGSQHKLPKITFARMLLMTFVLFCLVMRSSYTGSLFNMLKNDIGKKEIKSIKELDELGFTFYIYETLASRLNGTKALKK
jgi:hypothetical protein